MSALFSGMFARGGAADACSDLALLQAMLDFEVALLRALVRAGIAPAGGVDELAAAADAQSFDLAALGASTRTRATPVPGMLSELRARVSQSTAGYVHAGATSQDVLDTAMMLVARRALGTMLEDLTGAADACARLAEAHRTTAMPGRTLLQQALPITFGVKAAGWLAAFDAAGAELSDVRDRVLAVQLGGAVGTLAAYGERGLEIAADVAGQLGLAAPGIPWHTERLRVARLAGALGSAVGAMGKVARDVTLLTQTEVGEVIEGGGGGRGGSSTMPHKRNPVGAVTVVACASRTPALVATILAAMLQEHERGAGSWQAEWEPMLELLRLTGSAAAATRELVQALAVDRAAMRTDLARSGGLIMSESVAGALASSVGRAAANELVERAARLAVERGRPFREVLLELPEAADSLGPDGLDRALDPDAYLGVSDQLIDRALAAHRRS